MEKQVLDQNFARGARNLRPNTQRGKNALVLAYVMLGMMVMLIISQVMEYSLVQNVQENGDYLSRMDELRNNDLREMIIGILYFIMHVIFIVFFIMWFRRAYYNLAEGGVNLGWAEGWAAGSWFVPFVNLGRPFNIMREMWQSYHTKADPEKYNGNALIGWWWALFLGGNILSNTAARMSFEMHSMQDLLLSDEINIVGLIISVPALLLLIMIMRKFFPLEQKFYEMSMHENPAAAYR